jgi:NitT/TauT family transport system ATP-binding protein
LAVNPVFLLMDEPFGVLNEQTRLQLGMELTRIWMMTQKTLVFVTHSLMEAARFHIRFHIMMQHRTPALPFSLHAM